MIVQRIAWRAVACAVACGLVASCGSKDAVGPGVITGTWAGSTSQDRAIELVVDGNNVAEGTFSYVLQGESCSGVTGAVVIQGGASVPIEDGEFRIPRTQIGQTVFLTAEGVFTSSTAASGSFTLEDRECETRVDWTATRQ